MARAAKKKVRPETPPLYGVIENGVIKPAFPYDQERLMSFRRGAKVLVWVDYEGSRPGQRKWYAIINTALKGGNLPWADLSSADISLRLALDMYEPKKTNDGKWHRVPSSLNDYSDKELDEKIELLQALIYQLTGIDPKDFERERAGAGDEDFRTDPPAADNDAGAGGTDSFSPPESGAATPTDDNQPSTPKPVVGGVSDPSGGAPDESGGAGDPASQAPGAAAPNSRAAARGEPERFYREVALTYEGRECLTWPYAVDADGYAKMRVGEEMQRVHRRLCEEVHGEPPTPEHEAAHSCGKGHEACVTKGHLSWKTRQENMDDRVLHGTLARGEHNGASKLTEPEAREILALKGKMPLQAIADRYGVDPTTVSKIQRGESWDWLAAPNSEGELDAGNGAGAPSDSGSAEPDLGAAAPDLSAEDLKWLKEGATMMMAAQPEPSKEAKDVLWGQLKGILTMMPKNTGHDARRRMDLIKEHCLAVCRGEIDLDWLKVANAALCTVEDITPPPVTTGRRK